MSKHYILDEHNNPVPCDNLARWTKEMENHKMENHKMWRVGELNKDKVRVSTVFLGLDHNFNDAGPPVLFETMIFGGKHNEYQERCSTWEEAEALHKKAVKLVLGGKQ